MAKKIEWRGQDWQSELPMWSPEHPLYKHLGSTREIACNEFAACEIWVPNLDDAALRETIAAFGAAFTGRFYKAQRLAPTVALEWVARIYYAMCFSDLGNPEPERWLEYLDRLGIKIAPQSRSEFIAFLKLICGGAASESKLSKMAACLSEWVEIFDAEKEDDHGGVGWPTPERYDEIPGTSDFATWVLDNRGYTNIAEARSKRLEEAGDADDYAESIETIPATPELSAESSPPAPEPAKNIAKLKKTTIPETVWVVIRGNDEDDILVFASQTGAESYRDSYLTTSDPDDADGICFVRPEPSRNFDFAGCEVGVALGDDCIEDDNEQPPRRRVKYVPPDPADTNILPGQTINQFATRVRAHTDADAAEPASDSHYSDSIKTIPPAVIPLKLPTGERKETLLAALNRACHPETTTAEAIASLKAYRNRAGGLLPGQIWGEDKPAAPIVTDSDETWEERVDRQTRSFAETMEEFQRQKDAQWRAWSEANEELETAKNENRKLRTTMSRLEAQIEELRKERDELREQINEWMDDLRDKESRQGADHPAQTGD